MAGNRKHNRKLRLFLRHEGAGVPVSEGILKAGCCKYQAVRRSEGFKFLITELGSPCAGPSVSSASLVRAADCCNTKSRGTNNFSHGHFWHSRRRRGAGGAPARV